MVTLIHAVGALEGRCDAKCYEAEHPQCNCICGGRNHGVGLKRAIENTRELTREQVAEIERRGGYIADEVRQALLLDLTEPPP